ncbi:MAG: methyl-accepting chemotaxis protein [Nitrospirae bacterium]|nr:methyl-accepting chemotaxis protein [Nitrospirota bacterium]
MNYNRLSFKWKLLLPLISIVSSVLFISTIVIIMNTRNIVLEEAQNATMAGYRDTVLNALTSSMATGDIKNSKKDFLEHMRRVADVRVVRSEILDKDFGRGDPGDYAADDIEREVIGRGNEKVCIDGECIKGVYPYIARSNYFGRNCLSCHMVQEGAVLGAVSIKVPMAGAFQKINHMRNMYVLLSVLGVMAIAVMQTFLIGKLLKPLSLINENMEKIATGDLTSQIGSVSGDEIGMMGGGIDKMMQSFGNMINNIMTSVDKVVGITDSLLRSSAKTSLHAGEQTTQAEQIAVAAEEMSQTIGDIARNASLAADMSSAAMNAAEAGKSAMTKATEKVEQAYRSTANLASMANEMNAQAVEISSIITVIKDIAEQTNLLALNAAIEAARAGEQGRGFAVVADEVRKLAEKTKNAAGEISSKINHIQIEVEETSKAMTATSNEVTEATAIISQTGQSFDSICDSIQAAREQTIQIATAVEEQSVAAEEISRNIAKTSALTAEVKNLADEVTGEANDMVSTAEELMDATSGFRTPDNSDNRFVDKAIETAGIISALFQKSVENGGIALNDLFDEQYAPVSGTKPEQYTTRSVSFLERVLPPIQEEVLKFDPRVAFCAAVDRNAFLPVHNLQYSKAQRRPATDDDVAWNTANCRNRRFFKDRTGKAAAENQNRFLLRTYRRDMGGGQFIQMKDVSAPIFISGRHWGAVRIGYRATDTSA